MPVIVLRFDDFKTNICTSPESCPYCGCQGLQRWGGGEKPVRDTSLEVSEYRRYRCNACGRTFRHYVQGVDKTRHTCRIHQIAGIAWALGVSAREVVAILAGCGIELSYMTVWRDGNDIVDRFKDTFGENKLGTFCIHKLLSKTKGNSNGTTIVVDLGSGKTVELGCMDVADYHEVLDWLDPILKCFDIHVSFKDTGALAEMDLPDVKSTVKNL